MQSEKIFKNKYGFVLSALLCTALWGTAFPGVKLGYEWFNIGTSDTGSKLLFAGTRFMLAGIAVLLIYGIKNKKFPSFSKAQAPKILLLSAVQIAGNYFFYYLGLSVTAGSVASVLNSFDTFCTVLTVPLIFKDDKLTLKKFLGCAVGISGIILINLGSDGISTFKFTGEGFLLISALFSTAGIMINKKAASDTDPLIVTGYHLLFGGAALTAAALALGGKISFSSPKADLCLLYLAMVSAAAFFIWSALLKYNPVSKVSIFKLMTPIFGNVFSFFALGENILTPLHLLSLLLVCLGIAAVNTDKPKLKK